MRQTYFFTLVFLFLVLALSCNQCNNNKDIPKQLQNVKLDTSDTVNIKIHRYEKDLFSIDVNNLKAGLTKLLPKYSLFISDSVLNDSSALFEMKSYLMFPLNIELNTECQKKYSDMEDIETQLSKAFGLYKHYFPEKKTPEVFTYISQLDDVEPVLFSDSVMIIFLDWYLGGDYKYYSGFSAYEKKRFRKDFIVPDCMRSIARKLVNTNKENKNFLDYIINDGKVLYFLDATLPDTPDSLKMYYSPSQFSWCQNNEANIWSFIIDKKLLYSTETSMISKLCSDGPFTGVFSKESPSRTGIWIGWQIVRKYMSENSKVTIAELFTNQDSQDILTKSKYKPKK